MSELPEQAVNEPESPGTPEDNDPRELWPLEPWPSQPIAHDAPPETVEIAPAVLEPPPLSESEIGTAAPLFESFTRTEVAPPVRIPHLGHLGMLFLLLLIGLAGDLAAMPIALHFKLFGVSTTEQAATEIHYTLGGEGIIYLIAFAGCLLFFPLLWQRSFFTGIAWRGATAMRLCGILVAAAFVCFLLALLNGWLMPGPENAPIDKMFRTPGAAWLLFGFGVTIAPFFEELAFRGFLLPSLCTAIDWTIEQMFSRGLLLPGVYAGPYRSAEQGAGRMAFPLDVDGQPHWSLTAMVIASILTSVPFAGMHAAQTGYALGPFLLLVCVSLVLCAARLAARSLAASVLVHAAYNFMLFSLMLWGTGGFRHLENM